MTILYLNYIVLFSIICSFEYQIYLIILFSF